MNSNTIESKKTWEKFVLTHPEANFLSSWNWGEFQQTLGKQVEYRGYFKDNKLIGICLIVIEDARRGRYATIAGGPLLDWDNNKLINFWVEDIRQIANKYNCHFVRVRPQILHNPKNINLFRHLGFKLAPMHLTADLTLQLDLNQSLDKILKDMRKNTRYEINKSKKLDIQIKTSSNPEDIDLFYQHQLELAQKHQFVPFSYEFLKKQFTVFSQENQVLLISSYLENKLLATAFVIFYGQEAVYHYGISTEENNKLPGAYAAQWAAIEESKNRGMSRYNFWGIAPKEEVDHRFAGVSLFKRGFGGQEIDYLPAHDMPIRLTYTFINLFEKWRAKRRSL